MQQITAVLGSDGWPLKLWKVLGLFSLIPYSIIDASWNELEILNRSAIEM